MEKVNCSHCGTDNSKMAKYCSGCGFDLPKVEVEINAPAVAPKKQIKKLDFKKKILIAIVTIIAFCISYFGTQYLFSQKASFNEEMIDVASELNKNCPIMIDEETRLDNTVALTNTIFQYNYTLVHMVKSEVSTEELEAYIKPILINNIKSNPEMKLFRDHKVTLNYAYKDKNGVFVLQLKITPALYE
tara:strand:- start:36336 stop:36899 length:564 start_codon:yes stop_codon:yes gene_type:complete